MRNGPKLAEAPLRPFGPSLLRSFKVYTYQSLKVFLSAPRSALTQGMLHRSTCPKFQLGWSACLTTIQSNG